MDVLAKFAQRRRIFLNEEPHRVQLVRALESWLARQQFEQNGAEGIHIGVRPVFRHVPLCLFGRHVCRGAQDSARAGFVLRLRIHPRQAEIGDSGNEVRQA